MTETSYTIEGCPVTVALLADTHDADPAPLFASLRAHKPSLIALPGDFIHGNNPKPGVDLSKSRNALELLTGCAALAPTFVSLGNHEAYLTPADLDAVRSTGATLLENSYVTHPAGEARLVVGGLSSGYFTRWQWQAAHPAGAYPCISGSPAPETGWMEAYAAAEGYHILLMHHPEYISLVPRTVELVLSGHAHGGQWRFYDMRAKKWRGIYAPDQGLFPKLTDGVTDGRHVISRGLGNTAGLPRLHNETEIVYIKSG